MIDSIEREAAIYALRHVEINFTVTSETDLEACKPEIQEIIDKISDAQEKAIKALPSADKTGKWILSDLQSTEEMENGNYYYFCSNCLHGDVHAKAQEVPYCWYCGSYNGGGSK